MKKSKIKVPINLPYGGMKTSQTITKNNNMMYIFEHKDNRLVACDCINGFARYINVDPSNLYRTLKHKTYWCNDWRLLGHLDSMITSIE